MNNDNNNNHYITNVHKSMNKSINNNTNQIDRLEYLMKTLMNIDKDLFDFEKLERK